MKMKTSLTIDKELWKKAQKKCIDLEIDNSDYVVALIKKDLKIK